MDLLTVISGPVDPRIYGFLLYQNTSKSIRKYMGTSWKNIIFPYLRIKIFKMFRNCVRDIFFIFTYFLSISFLNYILRRWGSENDLFSSNKQEKSLDMNFISIKSMKWNFSIFVFFWIPPPKNKIVYVIVFERHLPLYVLENIKRPLILRKCKIISKPEWIKNIFKEWPIICPRI